MFTYNMSVRKQHLLDAGGFDEEFLGWGLEDSELGYRLKKCGLLFAYNPPSDWRITSTSPCRQPTCTTPNTRPRTQAVIGQLTVAGIEIVLASLQDEVARRPRET